MSLRGMGVPLPRTPEHMLVAENNPEGNADLGGVLAKLAGFTVAMVILPIGTYFVTRDYAFKGDTTWSAISAVTVANLILAGFVWIAFREDQADYAKEQKEKLKEGAKKKE